MADEQNGNPEPEQLDLPSMDLARTADFYGRLFDWSFEGNEQALSFRNEDGHTGSFHLVEKMPEPGPRPLPLIAVISIDDALQMILELEGGVIEPKQALEGVGSMARFADPDGNILGLVELAKDAHAG